MVIPSGQSDLETLPRHYPTIFFQISNNTYLYLFIILFIIYHILSLWIIYYIILKLNPKFIKWILHSTPLGWNKMCNFYLKRKKKYKTLNHYHFWVWDITSEHSKVFKTDLHIKACEGKLISEYYIFSKYAVQRKNLYGKCHLFNSAVRQQKFESFNIFSFQTESY